MYSLILSARFQKDLSKLLKKNPKLKTQTNKTLRLLINRIDQPSLRLHKLSGKNNWSVSVNMNIRIIIHIEGDKLYLLRIGTHDEVY